MLAVSGETLWMMSTPHGKRGFFWEEWAHGGKDWLQVSVPASECPRIPAESLAEEKRTLGDRVFRQEYMCEFGETTSAVFDMDFGAEGDHAECEAAGVQVGVGFRCAEFRRRHCSTVDPAASEPLP
jgi:hypothetical protein